ncbi:hypothetical protein LIP_1433 [Limnochorda pilosa]|uniref:Sporulation protein n=1 Tax=Limnochorda pilosa TaxID=1555112 RepID=A0A0K2SJU7_LIMPI|nr:hypothetical protein LIP_1433 [Limnochorda pilosa]
MLLRVAKELLLPFCTAFGVVLGGSLLGSLAIVLTRGSPLAAIADLSGKIRLWAIAVAIGGTFDTLTALESGLFGGQVFLLLRQGAVVAAALFGAHAGYWLLASLVNLRG